MPLVCDAAMQNAEGKSQKVKREQVTESFEC
jgi:hypothetical protein